MTGWYMTLAEAQKLDAADPLAFARERFRLPNGITYLDGNSLGALPVATAGALSRTAERQLISAEYCATTTCSPPTQSQM